MRCIVTLPCLGASLIVLAYLGAGLPTPAGRLQAEPESDGIHAVRHPSVYDIAWAPDGTKLVSLHDSCFGGPANLVLHDFKGSSTEAFCLPARTASSMDWNQDGLLAGGHMGEFWASALHDDRTSHQFRGKVRVRQIASANGRTAITTEDDTLWLGDTCNPCQTRVNLPFGASSLKISPGGTFLLISGVSQRILLLDARSGQVLREWQGHDSHPLPAFAAQSVREGRSGSTLSVVFVSRNGWLTMADPLTGAVFADRRLNSTDGIASMAVSPDGRTIALGTYRKNIELWDLWSGQPLATLKDGHANCVYCLEFSPNSRHLASGGTDGGVCIWNVDDGVLTQRLTME